MAIERQMQGSMFFPRRYLALNRLSGAVSRTQQSCIQASGGFGTKSDQKQASSGKAAGKKPKGPKQKKRRLKQPANPMAPSQPSPNSREEAFQQRMEDTSEGGEDLNLAFEERLKLLREKGEASQVAREKSRPSEGGILSSGPLDAPRQEPKKRREEGESNALGVPQVAVGAISLLLVGVFLFTSGFGPGGTPSPRSSQEGGLTSEQLKDLQDRAKELDQKLKDSPEDVDSLRELSDLSAVLGDLKKSGNLAERTTKAVPTDAKAWLALADARGRLADYRGAVAAYDKAIEASAAPSLPQLQGLATALVSDNRQSEAIQRLQSFEPQAGSSGAVGKVELQMLIGKVYSQWDRHFASALAVYDGLIERFPDDFRGYLARGALLKDNGRNGDAQRMFIQARFLAPPEARSIVDNVASR